MTGTQTASDGSTIMPSRPQYSQEVANASGSDTGAYYAIYTDPACSGAIGSGLETDFSNNVSQILIPIQGYDLSADTVDIELNTSTSDEGYTQLLSMCINTQGPATDATITSYGSQRTSNWVYLVASTSAIDTSFANAETASELQNIESTVASYISSISSSSGVISTAKLGGATQTGTDSSGNNLDPSSSAMYFITFRNKANKILMFLFCLTLFSGCNKI